MTERIVDFLKAVDIDHQHGHQRAFPPGLRESVCDAFVEQISIRERRQMVCPREMVQPLFHPPAIAYIARDAENLLRLLAGIALHQSQRCLEPHIVLIDVARTIDDRRQRPLLNDFRDRTANNVEVFRMHEFAQSVAEQITVRYAEDARRHRRCERNRSVRPVIGDQIGGVVGDQLVFVHCFDQRVFPLVQARGKPIERAPQREDFTAAGVAGQWSDPRIGGAVSREVMRKDYEGPHKIPRQRPDGRDHEHAGQ